MPIFRLVALQKPQTYRNLSPYTVFVAFQDIEKLGWCPAGPVLTHGEMVPWLATLLLMVSQQKCLTG